MARVSEPLDDTTPLDGSRIDVGARIGWLLRVNRGAGGLSLRQMAAAMADQGATMSAATLSRVESEGLRSVVALEGYARVLGHPADALQVAVDLLCRSFSYAPAAPLPRARPGLGDFSRACRAVEALSPTGAAWLDFSRHHTDESPFGLPSHAMKSFVRRLALEDSRSVGQARFHRWEAMLLLRCSAYGGVVIEVAEELLREPGLQEVDDLVAAVVEKPTMAIVGWAGELLRDPSVHVVRASSFGIQSMLVTGGLDLADWGELPPAIDRAWCAAQGDPDRLEALVQLRAALPAPLQQQLAESYPPTSQAKGPRVWTRNRRNVHYGFAVSVAHTVTMSRGLPDDPLLARLLFEAMFDPRGVRMTTASILLASSPYAADLVHVLLAARGRAPDEDSRPGVSRLAAFLHTSGELPEVGHLLASDHPLDFRHALVIYGRGGHLLPDEAIERGLAGDALTSRWTLTALGLAGDARLTRVHSDPTLPDSIRVAADWWLRHGPRIVD